MALQTRPFDPAEFLDTPDAIQEYLASAFESGDFATIADAIGVVAKARGMGELARETGLTRQSLYKALSPTGNPEFATILKVTHALGFKLTPEFLSADVLEDA
jgi:probable addiction module antidote protein